MLAVVPFDMMRASPDVDKVAVPAVSEPVRFAPATSKVEVAQVTDAPPVKMAELPPQLKVSFLEPAESDAVIPLARLSVTFCRFTKGKALAKKKLWRFASADLV